VVNKLKLLAAVLRDEELSEMVEADFQSEYGLDLRDLYRSKSRMTLRRCLVLFNQLPGESRVMKRLRNDGFSMRDHLLANIFDTLRRIDFSTNVGARANLTSESQSIFDSMPEPMKRPVFIEPEEDKPKPIKFTSTRELKKLMNADQDGKVARPKRRQEGS
jgi:hypothetical protein